MRKVLLIVIVGLAAFAVGGDERAEAQRCAGGSCLAKSEGFAWRIDRPVLDRRLFAVRPLQTIVERSRERRGKVLETVAARLFDRAGYVQARRLQRPCRRSQ